MTNKYDIEIQNLFDKVPLFLYSSSGYSISKNKSYSILYFFKPNDFEKKHKSCILTKVFDEKISNFFWAIQVQQNTISIEIWYDILDLKTIENCVLITSKILQV